jgi:hypothetical protein
MQMRVSTEFLQTTDDWRSKQPDICPRTDAIRRIVEQVIAAETAVAGNPSGDRNELPIPSVIQKNAQRMQIAR